MALSNASVSQLTDRQLMEGLRELARKDYAITADLLAHLGEIEARRLCDSEAEGSLFRYCVKVLNFSEGAAYKRITAARLARRYPVILEMVACGDLHVSALNDLSPHLTAENHRELLSAARRLSKRELQELIARLFPKPDAPTLLRKLPERAEARQGSGSMAGADAGALRLAPTVRGAVATDVTAAPEAASARAGESCAAAGAGRSVEAKGSARSGASGEAFAAAAPSVETQTASAEPTVSAPVRPTDRGSVAPLAPGRYRLQVTLSGETRDKLVRAQELMRHVQPDGDLAVVLDRALSCLVQQLESRKFGKRTRREKAVSERAKNGSTATLSPASPARVGPSTPAVACDAGGMAARDGRSTGPAAARTAGQLAPARVPPRGSAGRCAASEGEADLADSKDLPRALRREVAERDECRCTFVAADGRRCEERGRLEYHHIHARALGGKTTAENLTLRCQAHNLAAAVEDFGVDAVRRHGTARRSESHRSPSRPGGPGRLAAR